MALTQALTACNASDMSLCIKRNIEVGIFVCNVIEKSKGGQIR